MMMIIIIMTTSAAWWLEFHIFLEVVGLERGPLSLVTTTEELLVLGRKSSGSGLKAENTAVGIHHADHVAPFICKSWNYVTSLTLCGHRPRRFLVFK
jgi:hypothetical protein